LELEEVKQELGKILKNLPLKDKNKPLLLSGGGGYLKGLDTLFENPLTDLTLVGKEYYSALGGALKFVYPDGSPSFKKPDVKPLDLKVALFVSITAVVLTYLGLDYLNTITSKVSEKILQKERYLFSLNYPNLPPTAMEEQLKVLIQKKGKSVLPLLKEVIETLPEGVKVYKISYEGGVLKVEGETTKDKLKVINPQSYKVLENNRVGFVKTFKVF